MKARRILFTICAWLLFAVAARAQSFTSVTGVVVDPNGIPYGNGTMSATLTPGSPGGWTLNGQPYSGQVGPVTLDATGKFVANFGSNAVILPAGTQWKITVNSNPGGILPPLGTGAQTFTVTITISGASQNISATLNAAAPKLTNITVGAGSVTSISGTSPIVVTPNPITATGAISCPTCNTSTGSISQSAVYVSTSCGTQINCFTVAADLNIATSPVFTASSATITTGAGDPTFSCPGASYPCSVAGAGSDAGKPVFGTSGCQAISPGNCLHNCPQTTIATVNSAHSITAGAVCANNSSAGANTNWLIWGTDDGPALAAATAAATTLLQSGPVNMEVANLKMLVGTSPFQFGAHLEYPLHLILHNTLITGLPKINCGGVTVNPGCFLDTHSNIIGQNAAQLNFNDIVDGGNFWGGGIDVPDASATYTNPNSGINIVGGTLNGTQITGWNWNRAQGTPTYAIYCSGATLNYVNTYAAGNYGILGTSPGLFPCNINGGVLGGSQYNTIVLGGSNPTVVTTGVTISNPISIAFSTRFASAVYASTGIYTDHGSVIYDGVWVEGTGKAFLHGSTVAGTAAYNVNVAAGAAYLNGVTLNAAVNQTGGVLQFDSGTTWPPATGYFGGGGITLGPGNVKGACTGVATASQTLGLYGTGPNVTATTCTSINIGAGIPIQVAGKVLTLKVTATAGGVNGSSGVVTVLKNGSATAVTCTIGTTTSCIDITHSFTTIVGDLISIQFTTQLLDTLAGVNASVIVTP